MAGARSKPLATGKPRSCGAVARRVCARGTRQRAGGQLFLVVLVRLGLYDLVVLVRLGFLVFHEIRHVVRAVLGLPDLVEVVHPAGEFCRNRTLGTAILLLETPLALLAFRRRRWAKIPLAGGSAATTLPGRTRSRAKSARTRSAKSATTARAGTAEASAWSRTAVAPTRTRRAASGPAES